MDFRPRTIFLIFALIIGLVAITFLVLEKKKIPPLTDNSIQGAILDLANQPISGIPFMLYSENPEKSDCLYTCISNKLGKFSIPKPTNGIYYLVTILDKEKIIMPGIEIQPKTNYIDLQIIYYGSHPGKKPIEITTTTKPNPSPKKPNLNPPLSTPNNISTQGTLKGKVYVENKTLLASGVLELEGEHLDRQAPMIHKAKITNGIYEIKGLYPGIYQFKAHLEGYPSLEGLEVFILENQVAQIDMEFKKTDISSSQKGAEISVTVIDISWSPQLNAQVTLSNRNTGASQDGQTDENGEIIFHNVPPGEYEVSAVFNGLRGRSELREDLSAVSGKFVSLVLRETE